jgi:hypothetical protein
MKFAHRIVWLFSSPRRLQGDIAEDRTTWWQPWLWLSLLTAATEYFSMPIRRAVLQTNPNDLPLGELDAQLAYMDRWGGMQLIGIPVVLLFLALTVSGTVYVVVSLLSSRASFKRYFTITLYASIIAAISSIISTVVVRARGIDAIRSPGDAHFSLSLRFLAPSDNALLEAVLSSFELFGVWSLFFLGTALVRVFGMSAGQAFASVVPWWMIYVLLTLVGQAVGALG